MKKFQVVILAAGQSSRFWPLNQNHKSQINILGKPLIFWTIKNLTLIGIKDIILVLNKNSFSDETLKEIKKLNVKISCVFQKKFLGTGNALFQARNLIKKPFLVLHPYKFYIKDILDEILRKSKNSKIVLVGCPTKSPEDYGILEFKNKKVIKIWENPQKGKIPSSIRTLGIYFLYPDFFKYYQKVKHSESDLVDAINLLIKERKAEFVLFKKEIPSFKHPWDTLAMLKMIFQSKNFKNHISKTAKIGKNVIINGKVYIGENVEIKEGTILNNPCFIGDNCKIGPYNVFRGPVNLEKEVITGAFSEVKNCLIQERTHIHSGYFGDSIIGKNCRFGAGFISANRRLDRKNIKSKIKGKKIDTGLSYFGFVVGNNTRFGIEAQTMPGVLIGSNCIIGPGTQVFEDIKDNTIFYSVQKYQKEKNLNEKN